MKKKNIIFPIFLRYFLILILGLGNLFLFYFLFSNITIIASSFILSFFGKAEYLGNLILYNNQIIEIIPACIAGSAYYLLFILIFSTPKIKPLTRIKVLFASFILFFIFNILRISFLSALLNYSLFNILHIISWYFLSTIAVILIWVLMIKIFKISEIPIFSDIKFLYSQINSKKHKKLTGK
jgi:exosortase/archaeosortase family protein